MENIEINGVKYIPESECHELPQSEENGPWKVGLIYHIRTVTFAIAGRLAWVGPNELLLSKASWISDSGRFSDYLKGNADSNLEVEPYHSEVIIGRGSVVDASLIESFEDSQK